MTETTETRSIEVSVDIDASPEKVWKAVSEAEEISKWFAPQVEVVPGVGGHVTASWGPGMEGTSLIEVWEPNRQIRWAEHRKDPYCKAGDESGEVMRHIATDYFIEAQDGGRTTLRIVQSGFGPESEWDNEIESVKRGWPVFMRILKHNLEHHWGEPATNLTISTYSAHLPAEAWSVLMSERGFLGAGATAPSGPESRYAFRTPTGAVMTGQSYIDAPRQFTGSIENLSNALVGLLTEVHTKGSATYLMFTLYGMSADQVEELRKVWSAEMAAILNGVSR